MTKKMGSDAAEVEGFIWNEGTTPSNAISVEQYASDRDLHLSIMASLANPTPPAKIFIDLSDTDDDEEVRILRFQPQNSSSGKQRRRERSTSTFEKGESSNSNAVPFVCEICADTKSASECFSISGCSHAYCRECVVRYLEAKLQDNVVNIRCPVAECGGLLEAEDCKGILPRELYDRWGYATCEAVISAEHKFYCPYKDCSALLIHDHVEGEKSITESECPNCRRLFCAQCKVAWHAGIVCSEFQKLGEHEREKEDIMLMQLARNQKWRRCPKCKFYVEKSAGCLYMKCRCGVAFCYNCGTLSRSHSHFCHACKR